MSLNGNLEDLPLLDILQIVSFSRKTGSLAIRTPEGEGAIVFQDGFVVSSFAWDSPLPDPRVRALPEPQREKLVRNRIEMAIEQLIRLREGEFSFSLADVAPTQLSGRDLTDETLAHGLNAQELLLDLARGMDEDRRDSTAALEAGFAEPAEEPLSAVSDPAGAAIEEDPLLPGLEDFPADEPLSSDDEMAALVPDLPAESPAPRASPPPLSEVVPPEVPTPAVRPHVASGEAFRTILVVDDEPEVRHVLAEHLAEGGFVVVEAEDPDTAVKQAGRLGREGTRFILVTDLGMPTSGGTSFQGGFEVVKRLAKMGLRPPVLLMTESLSGALQSRARQLGISAFVFKPGLSKLDPEQFDADLRAFSRKILTDIVPRLIRGTAPVPGKSEPPAPPGPPPMTDQMTRELAVLQGHLDELKKAQDASQISIIVMKTARGFFERAILFLVKNDELRGLGAFGKGPAGENLNLLVREITIPLVERSPLADVVASRKPWNGPLADGKWTSHLLGRIGAFGSTSVVLFPLLTNRETVAVLFGDNPETGREHARLDALGVFMNQAGIALENAFLQRKALAMQGR